VRTITIRPARWRTWGFCVSFTVSSMRATGPGPPKRCARALASVPRHAGTSILVCEVEGSCVSTCTLVGCPNFSRSGRPFDAQRKCCDVPRPAQTGLWSKGRSTRDRGGPPTGMLPRKLMTGSRRQETLRAFMRRQECKGGRRRHSRHGLSRTPSALALAPTILFCLRAGSREPSWHRLAND
jgi:hypothetical protein